MGFEFSGQKVASMRRQLHPIEQALNLVLEMFVTTTEVLNDRDIVACAFEVSVEF